MKGFIPAAAIFAATYLLLDFCASMALAADAPASVNIQPLVTFGVGLLGDIGMILAPVVLAWIGTHVKNHYARQALAAGLTRAAGGVYEAIAAQGADIVNVAIKNAALASAVNGFVKIYPTAMAATGMTPDTVHEAIRKELGTLLATDPTVTITPGASPTAGLTAAATPPASPPAAAVPAPGAAVAAGLMLLLALAGGLAACAVPPASPAGATPIQLPAPSSPDETVAELEASYTAALTAATAYASLPRCAAGAPAVCSTPAIVTALAAAQAKASAALDAARQGLAAYDALATPAAADTSTILSLIAGASTAVGALTSAAQIVKGI